MSFAPWSFFSGQSIIVITEDGRTRDRGLYNYRGQSLRKIPGRITINRTRKTSERRKDYGEYIEQSIYCTTPRNYQLSIDLENKKADLIYFQSRFWKVVSSNVFVQLIPHCEAIAEHLTVVSGDLKRLLPTIHSLPP